MFNSLARVTLFLFLGAFTAFGPAQAADPFKRCASCHGADGNSSKSKNPSISGLSVGYAELAMKAYRDGSRPCPTSKMKCRMAAKWTDEEISAAAQHFAEFPRIRHEQEFDAGLAAQGKAIHEQHCDSCHSEASAGDASDGGLLNGQWREYLELVLTGYGAGERAQPNEMKSALAELGDGDEEALLHYYASDL
jgi:sulfide dehydrogenase cytochrome subunit